MTDKTREIRLRRAAQRRGLRLEKSRRRDPYALGYGTYKLTNPSTHETVAGDRFHYGLTLDQVEEWLYPERDE
jgi:hypothetical protein